MYVRRRRENFGIWHPQGRTSALTSLDLQLFCLLGQNQKDAAPREIQFAGVGSHGKPVETSELLRVQIWSKISVLLLPEASWSHLPRVPSLLGTVPTKEDRLAWAGGTWQKGFLRRISEVGSKIRK